MGNLISLEELFEKINKVLIEQDNSSRKRWLDEPTKVDLTAVDVPTFHPPFEDTSTIMSKVASEVDKQASADTDFEKRYLGKSKEENYFYLVKGKDNQFYIQDAEGKVVYGEKPEEKETDLIQFIRKAQKELELIEISADLFVEAIEPLIKAKEEQDFEEQGTEEKEELSSSPEISSKEDQADKEQDKPESPTSELESEQEEEIETELEKAFEQEPEEEEEQEEEEEEEEPVVVESTQEQEERIPGGKAEGMSDDEFDPEQLEKGTQIEMEHTDDPEVAKEIAKDHLAEFDYYYDALEQMEEELRKEQEEEEEEEEEEPKSVQESVGVARLKVFGFLKKAPASVIWDIYDSFVGSGYSGSEEIASEQLMRDEDNTERARLELQHKILQDDKMVEDIYQSYIGSLSEAVEVGFGGYKFKVEEVKQVENGGVVLKINGKPFQFSKSFVDLFKDEQGQVTEEIVKELAEAALSKLSNLEIAKLASSLSKTQTKSYESLFTKKRKGMEPLITKKDVMETFRKQNEARKESKVELEIYALTPIKLRVSDSVFRNIAESADYWLIGLDSWFFDLFLEEEIDEQQRQELLKLKKLAQKYKAIAIDAPSEREWLQDNLG